jgi:hypothetical protein
MTGAPNETEPGWLAEFRDPPAACGDMMFWSWNGEVTERRITEMLEQFAERGIGGAFLHPRPGMITEYLSERYWQLWEHALRESVRLGLECHIYDEDGFPSGAAGGLTLEAAPGASVKILTAALHEDGTLNAPGEVLAAYECPAEGMPRRLPAGADLGAAAARGPLLTLTLAEPPSRRVRQPDLCRPQATKQFIRLTHEEYAARFREHFGGAVKYVFTDEPGLFCRSGLQVSERFLEEFRREHGYDFLDRAWAVAVECEETPTVRFDYVSTANRLWLGGFVRPLHDWCEEHGLAFTGHYWEHEWPGPGSVPDSMAAYRWMQTPGLDMLAFHFDRADRAANALYLLTLKEVASVANQTGAERVLCETYGGGGYETAVPEFKPLSDWVLANGVNLNVPHLSHQTIAGARKYEWPHTISDHACWWDAYRVQAEHNARLTAAVKQGRERNRVLLLHPTLTGWMRYAPESFRLGESANGEPDPVEELQRSQCATVQALTDAQADFDMGDELVMAELGRIEGAELCVGEGRYRFVVLPEIMETWLDATLELVREFLDAGGTLLALGPPPTRLRARPSDEPAALARSFPERWVPCGSRDELVERLRALVPPRVTAPNGDPLPPDLTYYRRELDDGRAVHLFVNPWQGEVRTGVVLPGGGLTALDTATGQARPVPTERAGGGQAFDLHLPPAGHALYVSRPQPQEASPARPRQRRPVGLEAVSVQRLQPNVLVLDYCDVEAHGPSGRKRAADVNTTAANTAAWQAMGFARDPWHGVQFKRSIVDHEFPDDSRLELAYRFTVEGAAFEEVSASLELAMERPWLYEVSLNESPLDFEAGERWLDEDARKVSVAEVVRPGENVVRAIARPFHPLCEVAPLYVLGEFGLREASPGFRMSRPEPLGLGDWLGQGLPFYPWGVRYAATFDLPSPAEGLTVDLPAWEGSSARVSVDGAEAGYIVWPPHQLEAAVRLESGAHELAVDVTGNMKNLLGPHFSEGLPGIWSWEECPEHQPAGSAYRFLSCGLREPPALSVW